MIRGHQIFAEHFADFTNCYIAIGGLAAHTIMEEQNLAFRATKDFDLVLVIEALDAAFFKVFWRFVRDAGYSQKEIEVVKRQYYRFRDPSNSNYPMQIELFSRMPDVIKPAEDIVIAPVPVDDDQSSLSAILMDESYYNLTLENTRMVEGIRIVTSPALIILKIKAYLELSARREAGHMADLKNIKKHQNDIFRLGAILTGEESITVSDTIKEDIHAFSVLMHKNPPNLKQIFKLMGIGTVLGSNQILSALDGITRAK